MLTTKGGFTPNFTGFGLVLLLSLGLVSCAPSRATAPRTGPIEVVATIGMIADVTAVIGGEWVKVKGLMGPGVDPHLFKATPSDVQALQDAEVIFYGGLHLESKMGELFEQMAASRTVVAVTRSIPEDQLLSPPGFQGLHDPHVWFDVTLWQQATREIADTLIAQRPEAREVIEANAAGYLAELQALDAYVLAQAQRVPGAQRLLITAHDAFNYFGRRYGFEVVGLQGISTEAEAGTGDVQSLVKLIVDRRVKALFIESSVPVKNIQAVQEGARARGWTVTVGGELFSDAMGSTGTFEGTYLGMVRHNIDTVVGALLGEVNHE